jgi:hypothetical protein
LRVGRIPLIAYSGPQVRAKSHRMGKFYGRSASFDAASKLDKGGETKFSIHLHPFLGKAGEGLAS